VRRISPKPFEECTATELRLQRKRLVELHDTLVGQLYPPMVRQEIRELDAELFRKETGHRDTGFGITVRER